MSAKKCQEFQNVLVLFTVATNASNTPNCLHITLEDSTIMSRVKLRCKVDILENKQWMEDLIHHFHALDEVERFSEQLLEDFHVREHLFYQVLEFFGLSSLLHPVKATNLSKKKK